MTTPDLSPLPTRRTPAQWAELLRRLRVAYDGLGRGAQAELARPSSASLLRTDGVAWALLTRVFKPELDAGTMTKRDLGLMIAPLWLFRFAAHAPHDAASFRTGAWLRNVFETGRGEFLLRRLLGAKTSHALLTHALNALRGAGRTAAVEWGVFGADLIFWQFAGTPRLIVRENWASAFYLEGARTQDSTPHDSE